MARPRLLHIFSTFDAGGPQVRFAMLANRWGERFEHIVLASDGRTGAAALLGPRVSWRYADEAPPMKGAGLARTVWAHGRWLRGLKPDLLLTYNWGATEPALANRLIARLPHVHHEDGFGPDEAVRQNPRRVLFRRLALAAARQVIVPSHTLERLALEQWRLPARQLRFIANGVDPALYAQPPRPDAIPGLVRRPGELLVGCVGGLRPEKNPCRLVEAFAGAAPRPGSRLVLIGAGPEEARVRALASTLSIADRLVLPGFLADPHRYMGLLDLYAIPSDTEQFPISQVEAMAAGLAVTGMDVGDVRAILPAQNQRFIADRGDTAMLARQLRLLLEDADLRAAAGAANRAHAAATYPLARTVDAFEQVYAAAISARLPA